MGKETERENARGRCGTYDRDIEMEASPSLTQDPMARMLSEIEGMK